MTIADQYAHALSSLVEQNPKETSVYLANLQKVLARRGHQKLLKDIFVSYRNLDLVHERLSRHRTITPEQERTRILLELYNTLIA
jgi:hypothetical protein